MIDSLIDGPTLEKLKAAALAVRDNAHAPYSGFHVGAALLMSDGSVIAATNMENASYGLTICAETAALGTATAEGRLGEVEAVYCTGDFAAQPKGDLITPCGRCRQVIAEAAQAGNRDIIVISSNLDGTKRDIQPISTLLPLAFSLKDGE